MVKLKPCPFCGKDAKLYKPSRIAKLFVVGCVNEDCGVMVESKFGKTKEEAIAAWNKRAGVSVEGFNALIGWEE